MFTHILYISEFDLTLICILYVVLLLKCGRHQGLGKCTVACPGDVGLGAGVAHTILVLLHHLAAPTCSNTSSRFQNHNSGNYSAFMSLVQF